MAGGGENTGILPRARPDTSTGDTKQLFLGALRLLNPLGILPRLISSPEPPRRVPAKLASLAKGPGVLRHKDQRPLL